MPKTVPLRYQIVHETTYSYTRPVALLPHVLRLRPRCDLTQSLRSFSLEVEPTPVQITETIDLDGNALMGLYFSAEGVNEFRVVATSEVETYRTNPFAFLIEPWAIHLPVDYPTSLFAQLQPYLVGQPYSGLGLDPVAMQLAQEVQHATSGNVGLFLTELNRRIHSTCKHVLRETGEPFPPGLTWTQQSGSCRDLSLLLMEACRAVGLATRFVSGYHEGDPDWEHRHLHAWVEVYVPGGGWRGYDPTQGLAVGDRHIALVASPASRYTLPITGAVQGMGAQSTLSYRVAIVPLESDAVPPQ